MDTIKEFLSRRVAGIPVMVFVMLFAGVILFFALRMKPAAEVADTDTEDAGEPAGDAPDTSQPVFEATPVIYQASGAGASVASTPMPDSNELWGRRVREWLVAQGASVAMASAVVAKYLDGEALTAAEVVWRDKAIKQFGFPPETVDHVAPIPKPSGGTTGNYNGPAVAQGKPPLSHVVKGKSDDTPAELARLYYGTNSEDAVTKIKAANTTKKLNPAAVGTKVRIPERYDPRYYKATAATNTQYEIARKNGVTAAKVEALNPGMKFPVKAGTRVRIR